MLEINSSTESGKWFAYPDDPELQFKIRPTSLYSLKKAPGEAINIELSDVVDMYLYSLVDWKGVGENGKPIQCSREAKLAFLNEYDDIAAFIINKASEMKTELHEARVLKNSLKSQPGETPKSEKPVAKSA
jgi:hypothetical protein